MDRFIDAVIRIAVDDWIASKAINHAAGQRDGRMGW
jgi:hypothetical protein